MIRQSLFDKLLEKDQFTSGDPNDPEFSRKYPAYAEGTGENAKIIYDPGINTSTTFRSGYSGWASHIAQQYNITTAQGWAFGFLHELSHATGNLFTSARE